MNYLYFLSYYKLNNLTFLGPSYNEQQSSNNLETACFSRNDLLASPHKSTSKGNDDDWEDYCYGKLIVSQHQH